MADTESRNTSENQKGAEGQAQIELQIPGNLSGLEYLETVDKLSVQQNVNMCEALACCYRAKSMYVISSETGKQVYHAYEDSTCCARTCCCASRALEIHIMDMNGQEIIRVNKPLQTCAGVPCCILTQNSCFAFRIQVESPPGRPVGFVSQSCSIWRKPRYVVYDADHNEIFKISGQCDWPCSCLCCDCMCRDYTFRFYSTDGVDIGKCAKKWNGCCKETCTDANRFSVTFPRNLDVKEKATLVGAMFLIDLLHFEY